MIDFSSNWDVSNSFETWKAGNAERVRKPPSFLGLVLVFITSSAVFSFRRWFDLPRLNVRGRRYFESVQVFVVGEQRFHINKWQFLCSFQYFLYIYIFIFYVYIIYIYSLYIYIYIHNICMYLCM